ncbi:MAG TPA: Hsp20/alpha crystallin family protein [Gaiellaceae bacterium]|nr:Hsp20/alpha crystallin family protein [Gaiellaceae bacterium]
MTVMVKRSPFQELDSMERRMRRMFEQVGFAPTLLPAADVYETDEEIVVELEVPGFEEKELGVEVFDHQLVVKGHRTEAKEQKEKTFQLRERLEREFERRFVLPAEADTKHVKAKFEKGVLEVHTPKLAVAKPHKIEITKT